jgi:hypothetical protein
MTKAEMAMNAMMNAHSDLKDALNTDDPSKRFKKIMNAMIALVAGMDVLKKGIS